MVRGRQIVRPALVATVALLAAVASTGCGLAGGSNEKARGSHWTVTPQSTSTLPPVTSSTPAEGSNGRADTRSSSVQLTEEDRRLISVCQAVAELQAAGMAFWKSFDSDSGGLTPAATRIGTALSRLAEVSDGTVRREIEPVLAELDRVTGAPDLTAMRQAATEVIETVGARITTVLSSLQPLCPGQLRQEDLDQAERVDLRTTPPTD